MLELAKSKREYLIPRRCTSAPSTFCSAFPTDAVALIYRPARSAMTSGKAKTRHWKLRFERRTPPFIEPLMGWTGGDDPLAQVELTFPSLKAAVGYAERQGLTFIVHRQDDAEQVPSHRIGKVREDPTPPIGCLEGGTQTPLDLDGFNAPALVRPNEDRKAA